MRKGNCKLHYVKFGHPDFLNKRETFAKILKESSLSQSGVVRIRL